MRTRLTAVWRALLLLTLAVAGVGTVAVQAALPAQAASLQQVTNFGTNPSNLRMYVYVPSTVVAHPPILVAVHYCSGSASAFYSGGAHEWVTAADKYGYVIVFPEATRSGSCFDVYTAQALKRGGGSDPVGIMSMVTYAEQHYNGDPNRVYVMGASSGAMMTNVLAGDYPDVFKGGVAFSGVPFGCFATTGSNTWNSQCSGGQITHTAAEWATIARNAYPGYTGPYPRMQLWHGSTDTTLSYHNFGEEIKQWTALSGVSQTPASTDSPASSWTRTRYGSTGTQPAVEGISIAGTGHTLPQNGMAAYGIRFLGLDNTTPTPTTTTPRPTSPSPTTPSPTTPSPTTPSPTTPSPTTPSPTTPSPTTPSPTGSAGCTAVYSTASEWSGGFVANVTVSASQAITGWKVTLNLPGGASVSNGWNATFTGTSGTVTATNVSYNGTIAAGGSASFGYQGTGSPAGTTATCSPA